MPDRQTGELTAQEAKACVYRAQGKSKSECYRLAFDKSRAKPKSINEQATRLFGSHQMQSRVASLLASVTAVGMTTIGQCLLELEDWKRMAVEDRNHNALTSYKRMEMQAKGILKDNLALTVEGTADDSMILDKLSGKDKAKLAVLRAVLGAPEGFDPASVPDHETVQ